MNFKIEENGILYFLGESEPTGEEQKIIEEWKNLPVVLLVYDGPSEMRSTVEDAFWKNGILVGIGAPIFVKVRAWEGLVAFQLVYGEKVVDNFEAPSSKEKFADDLSRALKELFPDVKLPERFLLIVYEGGEYRKKIEDTRSYLEKNVVVKPVLVVPRWSEKHTLQVGERVEVVEEGFRQVGGRIVYVGKDMFFQTFPDFFENVEMVFLDGEDVYIHKGGSLTNGNRTVSVEDPLDVYKGIVLTKRGEVLRDRKINFGEPFLFRWEDLVLTASGKLVNFVSGWTWEVSNSPVEFVFSKGKLYVLDVCGFVRVYDLSRRRLIWERGFEGAWGLDVWNDKVYIGVGRNVLVLNEKDGEIVGTHEAEDFAVWEGTLLLFKNGSVDGESLGKGRFLRNGGWPVFLGKERSIVFAKEKRIFESVQSVRLFQWGIVVKTRDGVWLVRRE